MDLFFFISKQGVIYFKTTKVYMCLKLKDIYINQESYPFTLHYDKKIITSIICACASEKITCTKY